MGMGFAFSWPVLNPSLVGFRSLAGGDLLPVGDYIEGCPSTQALNRPTSVTGVYARYPSQLPPQGARMSEMGEWLPYVRWISLGEGGTPLLDLPSSTPVGRLLLKAEWMNPTGSHKDRASPLVIARATETGARGVACASSGNAGVSLAAYAARVGLACRVIVTASVPAPIRRRLALNGADIVEATSSLGRWSLLAALAQDGWYPATNYSLPASGSSAWGVEGYRSIALELAAELPDGIDAVIAPTARGDLIAGIAQGFAALREAGLWAHARPRVVAVEPFPRLTSVLAGNAAVTDEFAGATRQSSIAGSTATDQGLRAIRDTSGTAVVVDDAGAAAAQSALARQGIALELAAAAPIAALTTLAAQGLLGPKKRVVCIATAGVDRELVASSVHAKDRVVP
jgi:threonine synthase